MTIYYQTQTDGPILSSSFVFGLRYALGDSVIAGDAAPTWMFRAGAAITEVAEMGFQGSTLAVYHLTASERVRLFDALYRAIPETLLETLTTSDLVKVVQNVVLLDKLLAASTISGKSNYLVALVQTVLTNSNLGLFLGGFLGEEIVAGDALLRQYQAGAQVRELAILSDLLTNSLLVSVALAEGVILSDEQLLKMIYAGDPLLDGVKITCGWFQPSGSFTTWVVNTRTSAVTEYQNYVFNSFAQMRNQFLGANDQGLFVLNGELDDTASIASRIKTGLMSLGGSHFTSFKAIYLGMHVKTNGTEFYVKLHTGEGLEYIYRVRPKNMQTTKIDLGKGLRSRYFSFELESLGPAYDLDSVEFIPITTARRV